MNKSTRPYLLRTISAVAADETEAPEFVVMDGVSQWNKQQLSPAPGFNSFPFVRVRLEGAGTAGDVIELRGKLTNDEVITLARAEADTGGRFPAFVDAGERIDAAYGVRVSLAGATALDGVKVYLESYSTEQARVVA